MNDNFERVFWDACQAGDEVELQRLWQFSQSQGFQLNLVPMFRQACWTSFSLSKWMLEKDPTLVNTVHRQEDEEALSTDELLSWIRENCDSSTTLEETN